MRLYGSVVRLGGVHVCCQWLTENLFCLPLGNRDMLLSHHGGVFDMLYKSLSIPQLLNNIYRNFEFCRYRGSVVFVLLRGGPNTFFIPLS